MNVMVNHQTKYNVVDEFDVREGFDAHALKYQIINGRIPDMCLLTVVLN